MIAGYCRLSRDDDRRNYASIENQRLVISQYAAEHGETIGRWYEDDGISGYIFDRPGFQAMMDDLDRDIDTVFVKDFSRLGRHNARILLLLDEFRERGKRLVVIDDNYDSFVTDDDIIGIKTWYNERYVKDTSKKIRRVLNAKQKDGSLVTLLPFGYRRTGAGGETFEIIPEQAAVVQKIYAMYIDGYGYRRLAEYLTSRQIETPSMFRRGQELAGGKRTKRRVTAEWSGSMVKEILSNDFYTGTYRLHKRARISVHGRDRRVPEAEQYVFENHHAPVINPDTYELVQEIKKKRTRGGYRGARPHEQLEKETAPDPFGSCLYCKSCGHKMTPIVRNKDQKIRKYYVCSLYNAKGKRFCGKSHLIEESQLLEDVLNYLIVCRNVLQAAVETIDTDGLIPTGTDLRHERRKIREQLEKEKKQLGLLLSQKLKDIASHPENEDIIAEGYQAVQDSLAAGIRKLEKQYEDLNAGDGKRLPALRCPSSAADILDGILARGSFERRDAELLIDRIEIDEYGSPEICLRYGLSDPSRRIAAEETAKKENGVILAALRLIRDSGRDFTSVKSLLSGLAGIENAVTKTNVNTILACLRDMGVIEVSDNKLKPFPVVMEREELDRLIADLSRD